MVNPVSVLGAGLQGLDCQLGLCDLCAVFMGKIPHSHSVFLHPGVLTLYLFMVYRPSTEHLNWTMYLECRNWANAGGNQQLTSIHPRGIKILLHLWYENRLLPECKNHPPYWRYGKHCCTHRIDVQIYILVWLTLFLHFHLILGKDVSWLLGCWQAHKVLHSSKPKISTKAYNGRGDKHLAGLWYKISIQVDLAHLCIDHLSLNNAGADFST